MKKISFLVFFVLLQCCSFDNKSGIWKNVNQTSTEERKTLDNLKPLSLGDKQFDKTIPFNTNYKFNLKEPINISGWKDVFYNQSNNLENFEYRELNQLKYKSKKISRNITSPNILLELIK